MFELEYHICSPSHNKCTKEMPEDIILPIILNPFLEILVASIMDNM